MYDFHSQLSEVNFATIWPRVLRSFILPSEPDSGRTHLIMSTQSLSVILSGIWRCFWSATWAFSSCTCRRFALFCETTASFVASASNCSRCALSTTSAFPILVLHMFQCAEAQKAPFVAKSWFICASSSASLCNWKAVGITPSKTPELRPCSSAAMTRWLYDSCIPDQSEVDWQGPGVKKSQRRELSKRFFCSIGFL